MKWKIIAIYILFIASQAQITEALAQVNLSQKLTIPGKEMTLRNAFKVLSRQAKVDFAYNSGNIPLDERLILVANNESLESVLGDIADKLKLHFNVIGKTILIDKPKEINQPKEQQIKYETIDDAVNKRYIINGIVLDADTGLPLQGVEVSLTRLKIRVWTDKSGKFSILIPY